jgi:hypothetical protein
MLFHQTPEDLAIVAWYDSQTEETLAALPGYEDGLTPRQAWNAFFCPPPATNATGESLAAPAPGGQGVGTSSGFFVAFPRSDKGIDSESYRVAVLHLAAFLCEEPEFFEELALRLRNVAADGLAEHRGEFDHLMQRCRAHLLRFYGVQGVDKVVGIHGGSLA